MYMDRDYNMKINYILINGIMYIIELKELGPVVFKFVNNEKVELTDEEKQPLEKIIKKHSSYLYS